MRASLAIAAAAFLGGIAAAIVFFTGETSAGPVAFVLVCVAFTSAISALMGPIGYWGVPGDGN